jgi:peptidoglycan/LPS O-acetylase OafA/YrhL
VETNQRPTTRAQHQPTGAGHRILEIDGLRGIALTLVVFFHLFGHGRVSGGVDVFLTVSGFLLIMSLGRSLANGKPLGIVARWGRTFSRLAPPATLVHLAVTIASFVVLSPWTREQTLLEVVSTALYLENWQLITTQLAYGAAGPETSPLQHFWSLSVQAQFFIGFPLLVGLLARVVSSRGARVAVFWSLLGAATLASFLYAWHTNAVNPQAAYFDTFARFWELGAGGLLAGLITSGRTLPSVLRPLAGWLGLAMIISSGFIFDGGSAYPGPAALLPVGGAAFVLLSANGGWLSPTPLLRSRPLVFLDSISYGLYLWHWPILIVFFTINETDVLGWGGACVVMGLAVVFTLVSRWILSPTIAWATAKTAKRALIFAVVAILVAVVPAGSSYAVVEARSSSTVRLGVCAGAAALDPDRPGCADADHGDELVPALETLRKDDANRGACWSRGSDIEVNICSLGSEAPGALRILAVGDSHNNVWLDVYEQIADAHDWRIDAAGRAGCQWVEAGTPVYGQTDDEVRACQQWRESIDARAASGDYDAIITTASSKSAFRSQDPARSDIEVHTEALLGAWAHRPDETTPIIVLRDNPIFPPELLDCIADRAAVDGGECSLPRSETLLETGFDDAVARTPNAHMIDLSDYECGAERCDMVVGGVVVTRDGAHLTRAYAATLAPYLDRALVEILEGRADNSID